MAAVTEEQGSATHEFARDVHEASTGAQEVNSNISGVSQAAKEAGSTAGQGLSACGERKQQSRDPSRKVETFLTGVRAA